MLTLVAAAVLAWADVAPQEGRPGFTLVDTEGPGAALIVTFRVGYGDDHSLFGLSAQAQTLLLKANAAMPVKTLVDNAFSSGTTMKTVQGRYESHFVLTGTRAGVTAAAAQMLPALFSPRLTKAGYSQLVANGSPSGQFASEAEVIMQLLEPLLVAEGAAPQRGKLMWHPLERVNAHLAEFFTPANADIIAIGVDEASLRQILARASGGTRRVFPSRQLSNDVRREIPASMDRHIYGYPLPHLDATSAAGVRMLSRELYESLTTDLRDRGVAYSVDVELTLSSWFEGVLIDIPTFDVSGLDLVPYLDGLISRVVHHKTSPEEVAQLVAWAQRDDRRAMEDPAWLASALVSGVRKVEWQSPAYRDALAAMTPEALAACASRLFSNERKRFYVRFKDVPPETTAPTKPTGPKKRGSP
jgi:hypothetical protein